MKIHIKTAGNLPDQEMYCDALNTSCGDIKRGVAVSFHAPGGNAAAFVIDVEALRSLVALSDADHAARTQTVFTGLSIKVSP